MLLVEVVNVWSVAVDIIVATVVVAVVRSAVKVAAVDMSHTNSLRYRLYVHYCSAKVFPLDLTHDLLYW